jgi:hypothetical protein
MCELVHEDVERIVVWQRRADHNNRDAPIVREYRDAFATVFIVEGFAFILVREKDLTVRRRVQPFEYPSRDIDSFISVGDHVASA